MKEAERLAAEERLKELERIAVQKEADEIFKRNEEEKVVRRRQQAETVAAFRVTQAVSTPQYTYYNCNPR